MKLVLISVNGKYLADSREVAEMTKVRHADLLEKIEGYVRHLLNGKFRSVDFFMESTYVDESGRTLKCYHLTKKGCDMVANKMTGEKGVLFTATYVTEFEEMERQLNKPLNTLPQNYKEALLALVSQVEKTELLEAQLEATKPLTAFAQSLQVATNSILIGELAKLLKQNGINIGRDRLFETLRRDGYLMSRGSQYNAPTQRSMDLKLMEIKVGIRASIAEGTKATQTTKITGKGIMYFINKFKDVAVSA